MWDPRELLTAIEIMWSAPMSKNEIHSPNRRNTTMTDTQMLLASVPTGLWLGGSQAPALSGKTFDVHDPATGKVLCAVADAGREDGVRALDRAAAVQAEWAAVPPRTRSIILRWAWEQVMERAEDFALLMTLEMGKALAESRGEVAYGGEFLRWFAEEAVRINGRYTSSPSGSGRILVTKEPVGPTLAITPWNFPLAMGTRKIAPALAAGCTMIVKPAAETPLTMLLLGRAVRGCGLAARRALDAADYRTRRTDHTDVRRTTAAEGDLHRFHGHRQSAVSQAAQQVLRTSMELGGNAPFVVFDDADVDAAVEGAMAAKMRNGGEACTAANRIYVDNRVKSEFTEKLADRMRALKVGPAT